MRLRTSSYHTIGTIRFLRFDHFGENAALLCRNHAEIGNNCVVTFTVGPRDCVVTFMVGPRKSVKSSATSSILGQSGLNRPVFDALKVSDLISFPAAIV